MIPAAEAMRGSGQYGARVPVADDAPVQDRLLGFDRPRPGLATRLTRFRGGTDRPASLRPEVDAPERVSGR